MKYGFTWENYKADINLSRVWAENTQQNFNYDGFPEWVVDVLFTYNLNQYGTTISMSNHLEFGRKTFQRLTPTQSSTDLKNYYRTDLNVNKRFSEHFDVSLDIINLFDNNKLYSSTVVPSETLRVEPGTAALLTVRYRQ